MSRFPFTLCAYGLLVPLVTLQSLPAHTQTIADPAPRADSKEWMLLLAALVDEESYDNLFAAFNLGITDSTWLSLSAGRSRAPSTEASVSADLFSLGIEHNFGPVGFVLATDRWGDENALESEDWREEIFVANGRFRVALLLEQRDIDIFFSGGILEPGLRRRGIDADGIGLGGRLRVGRLWRLYGSWMDYDYPAGIRLIPRAENLDLLGESAATLAYSLVDRSARVGIERAVGRKLVNLDLGSDRSAVDGVALDSLSAGVLWPVGRRLDLEVHLGTSRAAGDESSLYGGLTLIVYGGG
jgi:hypothetical protein